MNLTNVTVFGFKTFAQRTSLDFQSGITAIVGPNGSGKSNLVDAIRWVLGEQRSKSLRSSKTEDVIFAGNDQRKALGMTEVSLTFDNSDGRLPIEFSQVQLTRRAYRAGETEYYINRTHVRLRDVMDLLVGTGLGSGSYAIVSQGEIDAILESRPSERRTLFEETAGINRFLARKNEAMRRLEQTQTNAIRINDLIAELQRRIPELDGQIRRAKRHRKLSARLRDMEILSYLRASVSRRAERERIGVELEHNRIRRDAAATEAAIIAAKLSDARYGAYQRELKLEEQRAVAGQRRAELARLEAEHAAALARREALVEQGTASSADAARVAAERGAMEETIVRLESAIAPLHADSERLRAAEHQAQRALSQSHAELDAIFTSLREVEAAEAKMLAQKAALRVQSENARVAAERFEDEASGLRAACQQLEIAVDRGSLRYGERERDLKRLEKQLFEVRGRGEDVEAVFARASGELAKAEGEHRDYGSEIASAQSRLQTIEELETSLAGHVPGTRAVIEAFERGELAGVEGIVANVIEVEERYARVLDVAFGARLSNIIMTNSADARRALEYLTINELGRATFLPLDVLRSRTGNEMGKLAGLRGVIGYAHTLIRTKRELAGVINFLVGKVLVVDTLETGITVVEQTDLRDTIVSLSGEQILGGGAISGGRAKKERSILSRRLQAAALREQLPDMIARLYTLKSAVESARERSEQTSVKRDAVKEEASQIEIALAELRVEIINLSADIERSERDLGLSSRRVAELESKAEEFRREQREFEPSATASPVDEERARLEAALDRGRQRIAQAEEVLADASALAANVREQLAKMGAQREAARARLGLLDADTERSRTAGDMVRAQIVQLQEQSNFAAGRVARMREE
ncbi:MAG: chromosome segregation protein SMC, partial [Candidatus Eremiobacteraeota bacterium]|nr:chromosome segregation protein SMC [Candidatus Eremiobacteraeota bacterium]